MKINKRKVQKKFAQNAATYDQYAVIQKKMAQRLLTKLINTKCPFIHILEIGCGTGFLTTLLAKQYPQAQITAIDIAPSMIELAQVKLDHLDNIDFLVADGEELPIFDGQFDLIVSNATFQWFSNPAVTFANYHSLLVPRGHLMFSTFGAGTFKELYNCLGGKQDAFITRNGLLAVLENSGFKDHGVEAIIKQEYFPCCRDFLWSLKKIGAHSSLLEQGGLGNDIFSLIKLYDQKYQIKGMVPATYHCLYGWGRR